METSVAKGIAGWSRNFIKSWNDGVCAFMLFAYFAVLSGCTSLNVVTDHNPDADFSSYQSFAFMPEQTLRVATQNAVSPLLEGRLKDAATQSLVAQGYRLQSSPERADFVVSFTLGAREKIRVESYPVAYRGTWGWGARYYQQVDVTNYTEGTLAIDLFETRSGEPVWHGRTSKKITTADRKNPTPIIDEIVSAILAEFPPRNKAQ